MRAYRVKLVWSYITLMMSPAAALADSVEIARIEAPDLTSVGGFQVGSYIQPSGFIVDGSGETMWRIQLSSGSIEHTWPLSGGPALTRGLTWGPTSGFYSERRMANQEDALAIIRFTGEVEIVGPTGSEFGTLSIAWKSSRTGGPLYLITDRNGGELHRVNRADGSATLVRDYKGALGRPTALAWNWSEAFVASIDGNIYQIFTNRPDVVRVTSTGLSEPDSFIGFGYNLATERWYGVEERRSVNPPEWHLREITGMPTCDPCDMNCDGDVNAFDIEPFLGIGSGCCPPCNTCTGDVNGDGRVDAFDIEPFLECLFP